MTNHTPEPCAASVFPDRGPHYDCTRNGKLFEDGKWWCKQHAPSVKAQKAAALRKKIDKEIETGREVYKRREKGQVAYEHTYAAGINPEAVKDLRSVLTNALKWWGVGRPAPAWVIDAQAALAKAKLP